MDIRADILQKIIDNNEHYLMGNRYVQGFGSHGDHWESIFFSANLDRELWEKKVDEMPYGEVRKFANAEVICNVFFGNKHPPFQRGIRYGEFTQVQRVTCNANELIKRCLLEEITDYYKVVEAMEELAKKEQAERPE